MKKTAFRILIVLFTLVMLVMPAFSTAAQEKQPAETDTFLTPEMVELGRKMATQGAWLLLVIALDVVMGVVVAVKNKVFQWQKLANFLSCYGPQVLTWVCLELLGLLPADLKQLANIGGMLGAGAYAFIFISAAGSVLASAKEVGVMPVNVPGIEKPQG